MPAAITKISATDDIREYYLQILFKRKNLFFVPLIVFIVLSIAASFLLPKEYEASTTVLIEEKATLSGAIRGIVVSTPIRERIRTIQEEILSWNRVREIMRELGMDIGLNTPKDLERAVRKNQKKIQIRQKGSDVVQIAFVGRDPALVQNFVNTITQKYIEKNLRAERQQTYSAIDFLQEQLASYEKKISESEKALAEFRTRNIGLLSIPIDMVYEEMVKLQTEAETLNLEISNIEQQIDTIERQLAGEQELIITESVRELNPVLAELRQRLIGFQSQLSQLQLKYTDKHPAIMETQRLIDLTERQVKEQAEQVVSKETETHNPIHLAMREQKERLALKMNSLKARRRSIEEVISNQNAKIQHIPSAEQSLAELTRSVEVNKTMYTDLLSRLEQAKISQQLEATDRGARFEILDPARLPRTPVAPSKAKIILIGIFLGIAVGGGLVYVSELLDHSLRGVSDTAQFLDIPIIGTIPAIATPRDLTRETRNQVVLLITVFIFLIGAIFLIAWVSHLMIKFNI